MEELRVLDSKTLVLYTNDSSLVRRVSNWRECFKVINYEQEQYSKKRVALVGVDIYLPRNKRILRRLQRAFTGVDIMGFLKAKGFYQMDVTPRNVRGA